MYYSIIIVAVAIFAYGCETNSMTTQNPEHSTAVNIQFNDFAGSTAEAGQPDAKKNPFAPATSRIVGDSFVHYIEHTKSQQDIVRFWFPETPKGTVMPVDYEILQSKISGANGEQVVDDEFAIKLLVRVFFQEYTQDFYTGKISNFSFQRIGSGKLQTIPYPETP